MPDPLPPGQSDPNLKPVAPSMQGLLWTIANSIFKREAVLIIASTAVIAVSAVWAKDKVDAGQQAKIDAGISPVSDKLDAHIRESKGVHERQDQSAQRQEAKIDRLDQRMEQFIDLYARSQGIKPPPPPPLIMPDGGTP